MANIKRIFRVPVNIFIVLLICNLLTVIFTTATPNVSLNHMTNTINPQDPYLTPQDNAYSADLHWVKTNITIDSNGLGTVSMILNCTPTEDHVGIFIRTIEEANVINLEKTYAFTEGEILGLNITAASRFDVSYYLYLKNVSKVQAGKPILYYFSYSADFFKKSQIFHYGVETNLVGINLVRPDWDDGLEFESLRIQLPVAVSSSNISSTFLEEIGFRVEQLMIDNYNLSYVGQIDADNQHWLTFISSKENIPAKGAFEATFYLSIEYFSLPKVLNWFVITFSLLFSLIAIALFVVVISVKNKSREENIAFQAELYDVLKQENE